MIKNQKVFRVSPEINFESLLSQLLSPKLEISLSMINARNLKLYNHIDGSKHIGRKQLLTINVVEYFKKLNEEGKQEKLIIPETFIIKGETNETDMKNCIEGIQSYDENTM
jgi:hypothetical protein